MERRRPSGEMFSLHSNEGLTNIPHHVKPKESSFQKANKLTSAVREKGIELEKLALERKDPILWIRAIKLLIDGRSVNNFEWIFNLGDDFSNYSLEDYLNELTNNRINKTLITSLKFMISSFSSLKDKGNDIPEGKIRLTLRRYRRNGDYSYNATGILPSNKTAIRDMFLINPKSLSGYPTFVYYECGVSCVNHSADILFKSFRNTGGIGETNFVDYLDFLQRFDGNNGGVNEFMNPDSRETQHAERYFTEAFLGYYTNEINRIVIPEELYEVFLQLGELEPDKLVEQLNKMFYESEIN